MSIGLRASHAPSLSQSFFRTLRVSLALAGVVSALGLTGCSTPPLGDRTGRVEPGRTTEAEQRSGQVYISDLDDATEKMSMKFIADLNGRLAESDFRINGEQQKVTIVFGDITNKSGSMPSSDIEAIRSNFQSNLMESEDLRARCRFVRDKANFERLRSTEFGPGPTNPTTPGTGVRALDQRFTYFLNSEIYGINRGSTRQFTINFSLMRASDGEEVWKPNYKQTYSFD